MKYMGLHIYIWVQVDGEEHIPMIICTSNVTSATTGLPKAVCLTHAMLVSRIIRMNFVNSDDVILCFTRISGISGIGVLLMGTLYDAKRIITTEPFSPELQFTFD